MYQTLTRLRVEAAPSMLVSQMGLGDNIKNARIAAGFENAAAFARLIGVSAGTLGDWEVGRYKKLRLDNLIKIAKGTKCRVEYLVSGFDDDYDMLWRGKRDLVGPTPDQKSDLLKGRPDVPASATSARVLTDDRDRKHKAAIAAMQDVVFRLTQALAAQGVKVSQQNARGGMRKPSARGGARKTG